jgi:hypothetical protein
MGIDHRRKEMAIAWTVVRWWEASVVWSASLIMLCLYVNGTVSFLPSRSTKVSILTIPNFPPVQAFGEQSLHQTKIQACGSPGD